MSKTKEYKLKIKKQFDELSLLSRHTIFDLSKLTVDLFFVRWGALKGKRLAIRDEQLKIALNLLIDINVASPRVFSKVKKLAASIMIKGLILFIGHAHELDERRYKQWTLILRQSRLQDDAD